MPVWRQTACINPLDNYIQATHAAAVHCKIAYIGLALCADILGFHIHLDKCSDSFLHVFQRDPFYSCPNISFALFFAKFFNLLWVVVLCSVPNALLIKFRLFFIIVSVSVIKLR